MIRSSKITERRGAMLPLMAFVILGLAALLALSIDIGMIAIAREQCQNAADAGAMAGARTLNGNAAVNYNFPTAPSQALQSIGANQVMGALVQSDAKQMQPPMSSAPANAYSFTSGQATIEIGTYAYTYNDGNSSSEKFAYQFPRTDATEPYTAVRTTVVNQGGNVFFGKYLGWTKYDTSAYAIAVHRPRDVIIIMDLSGSMRFQSLPGIPLSGSTANPASNSAARTVSMNPETVFPQFGHYADVATAALQGTKSYSTGAEWVDPANISASCNSGPPICADFYQNAAGVAAGPGNVAFARAPDSQDKTPGGYNYLKITNNTGATYAATVKDIVGATTFNTNFESKGYDQYLTPNAVFYTQGPGYWGKTIFAWPPDPRGSLLDANTAANHANNGAKDWRQRFFFKRNSSTGKLGWLDQNTVLFNTTGSGFKTPGTTTAVTENGVSVTYSYRINYAAIFHWLRNQDPKPFPPIIRAGRIKYYDAIPDPSDTTLNNRFWTTATLGNLNERFWKDYLDFVLGLKGTGAGTYTNTQNSVALSALIGNGNYFLWTGKTVQIKQKPDVTSASATYQTGILSGNYASGYSGPITAWKSALVSTPVVGDYVYFSSDVKSPKTRYRVAAATGLSSITLDQPLASAVSVGNTVSFIHGLYMDYADNPYRPRHQLWFGPMTFVDWLGNYNTNHFWWPGNVHEAQAWACKVGINSAIDDIKHNHPGDFIGMTFFSTPKYSSAGSGHHNTAIVPLGRNYQQLKDSLWFPPSTVTGGVTEITPYDTDFDNVPRAKGGTAPGMSFMIAYNLLSSSSTSLRTYAQPQPKYRGTAGGLGRKGAQRVIIFETDGAPNTRAVTSLGGAGSDSYYKVRIADPANLSSGSNVEWPLGGTYADLDVYNVVDQICKLETASPPGYSTTRRKVLVYPIGYGSLFDPANPSTAQTDALDFMQNVAYRGNTATNNVAASFPDMYRIYGTNQQRIDRIRTAFSNIMQSGVQVTLIE